MYQTIHSGMKKDDYELSCEIIESLNIALDDIEKIKLINELPEKYKGKISIQHVQNILLSR